MLGKVTVSASSRPRRCASARHSARIGWSALTSRSAPSSWWASRLRLLRMRSMKKPTADSEATATISATSRKRNSPARQSRAVIRNESISMGVYSLAKKVSSSSSMRRLASGSRKEALKLLCASRRASASPSGKAANAARKLALM